MMTEAYAELHDRNRYVAPFLVQESSARSVDDRVPLHAPSYQPNKPETEAAVTSKPRKSRKTQDEDDYIAEFARRYAREQQANSQAALRHEPLPENAALLPEPVNQPLGESEMNPVSYLRNEATLQRKPKLPVKKVTETLPGTKPPRVGVNIEWVQKGVGWDCREVYYVGKKRHRRHLGHIGRQKWEDMQVQYQGLELERMLSEWIEARRAEKSMALHNENN